MMPIKITKSYQNGYVQTAGGILIPSNINNLTADTDPDITADYAATYDASTGTLKKVLLKYLTGRMAFRAYRDTSSQSINDATFTKIQFNAETFDPFSMFDSTTNYEGTVPSGGAGVWGICLGVGFSNMPASTNIILEPAIAVNGSNVNNANLYYNVGITSASVMAVTAILNLADGDIISGYVYQSSGNTRSTISGGSSRYTYLAAARIGNT
jgi:hypothetical protein